MKKYIFSALLMLVVSACFAQANKFSKDDFGIRYGVFLGNNDYSSELNFSGMVTNNIEIGSGISVSYYSSNSQRGDSVYVYTRSGSVRAVQTQSYNSAFLGLGINPFVAYHFPIKSNLDVYAGVNVGAQLSYNIKDESVLEVNIPNYLAKATTKRRNPLGYAINGGIMVGCRYFFYKNIALGVQAGLGAGYSSTQGKSVVENIYENSGSENPVNETNTSKNEQQIKNQSFNLRTIGNVGVTLSFYISSKKVKE